jgi:hypothetical protein
VRVLVLVLVLVLLLLLVLVLLLLLLRLSRSLEYSSGGLECDSRFGAGADLRGSGRDEQSSPEAQGNRRLHDSTSARGTFAAAAFAPEAARWSKRARC